MEHTSRSDRQTSGYVPFADLPDMPSTSQAAKALGCCQKTVRVLIDSGQLFAVRVGRTWRVPKASLIDFAEGRPPRAVAR